MLDIVVNHNGWPGSAASVSYSRLSPFNDTRFYHSYCPIANYNNQSEVENCWLGDSNVQLPDLKTEDGEVARMYANWIKGIVGAYESE